MTKSTINTNPFYPIIIALLAIIAVFTWGIYQKISDQPLGFQNINKKSSTQKLSQLITYIDEYYVDTIQKDKLIDETIQQVLQDLDPHSYYISKEEMARMNEPLEGNFEGIGVEFRIIRDTLVVINVVEDGPSSEVGMLAGDRVLIVDSMNIAGVGLTNDDVFSKLRGPKGSKVSVVVKRAGNPDYIEFNITRGKIPIQSLSSSYMINNTTGYTKLIRFSKTTSDEFNKATEDLLKKGMKTLILDLRGNGGGYLNAAIAVCDEFLQNNKLVVYTEGKSQPRRDNYATSIGELEQVNVVIIIDQNSASASEIVAGAIQDNDRGTIVGRRSFGKGLVQTQLDLADKSAIRLTTARYYTPTGRSIQKPYGEGIDYNEEFEQRYLNGELEIADSIHVVDSLMFTTPGGNIVYGGGGIVPDIFVPFDTTYRTAFFSHVIYSGTINTFAFDYADSHRPELKQISPDEEGSKYISDYRVSDEVFDAFIVFANEDGFNASAKELEKSGEMIRNRLKALIGRNIWGNELYYKVLNQMDKDIEVSLVVAKELALKNQHVLNEL
jgi:carboxyl-terminal processing protease